MSVNDFWLLGYFGEAILFIFACFVFVYIPLAAYYSYFLIIYHRGDTYRHLYFRDVGIARAAVSVLLIGLVALVLLSVLLISSWGSLFLMPFVIFAGWLIWQEAHWVKELHAISSKRDLRIIKRIGEWQLHKNPQQFKTIVRNRDGWELWLLAIGARTDG